MKKTILILSALLLGLVSCNKAEFELNEHKKAEETGLVEVTMQLAVPMELTASTKASDRDKMPHIDHIRVAVFGTSGYPQAYALADPVTGENQPVAKYADENSKVFYFKVLLPVYEGEAHVHIIANGDENIQFVDMTEDKIMTTMKTTNNVGAYWARVILPDGILTIKDENGIMETTEEGNFVPSAETAHMFEDLVLVRNFAQVTLKNIASNFVVERWTLVNTPQYGSVAPVARWQDKIDDDGNPVDENKDGITDQEAVYVEDYQYYVYNKKDGKMVKADLDDDGNVIQTTITDTYNGYMVPESDGIVTTIPDENTWTTGDSCFVYERVDPNKNKPTCVLVKGYYNGETTACYYRIDLMNEDIEGGFFPIYRNYNYKLTIGEVGNRGALNAADAMLRDSGGNVSMTPEAQSLTDISDGKSRLFVEYVDKTFVTGTSTSDEERTKTLWVYYIPDVTDTYTTDVVENGVTIHRAGEAKVDNTKITTAKIYEAGDAIVGAVKDNPLQKVEAESSADGVYVYKFTLNKQDANKDLVSELYIEANNGLTGNKKSKLAREIKVRVMKQISMRLEFEPNPADETPGSTTVLHIHLADTLQQSMFPLEFHIEDVKHTLNPTGKDDSSLGTAAKSIEVPVKTDKSLADGTTNSFYFIRTVNWSEYRTMRDQWIAAKKAEATPEELANIIDFRTEFKTLVRDSKTTVYVHNEYFAKESIELLKPAETRTGTATFTGANFSAGNNQSATQGPIKVEFTLISSIWSNNYVEVSANSSTTMTITPISSASMQRVKITGITLSFLRYNYQYNFNPASISGSFTGGTGDNWNNLTATYNGNSTDQPVISTLTARTDREIDLNTITVTYSYIVGE